MEVLATETQAEAMANLSALERDRLLKLLLTMKRSMAAREAETRAAGNGPPAKPEPGALDVG